MDQYEQVRNTKNELSKIGTFSVHTVGMEVYSTRYNSGIMFGLAMTGE